MAIKKGKRATITGADKQNIIELAIGVYPTLPRGELAEKIIQTVFEGRLAPEIEVLEKLISKFRNAPDKPEDKPWNMATLGDYPLPPEALPKVLILQQHTRGSSPLPKTLPEAGTELPLHPLTIREAAWVARLYTLIGDIRSLHLWAIGYAMAERVSFLAGHSFDSSNMDKGVFENSTRRKH